MSRAYTSRTRPAQTTRPTPRMNPTRGMSEELPMEVERDVSPRRREPVRGEGFTMFPPDENKRQAIQRQADEEKRKHEEYKKAARPHFSYVGTVGGSDLSVETRETAVTQGNLPSTGSRLTPQQKSQRYREQEKQRQEKEREDYKQKQRQKSVDNDKREVQRRKELEADRRRKNNAWLDKVEGKSSEKKMENQLTTAAASSAAASISAASSSATSASAASASATGGNTEEVDNREFVVALDRLESMFPLVDKDFLESLLKEIGNDVDRVVELLS